MASPLENISIIIPVAHDETHLDVLLSELAGCGAEILTPRDKKRAENLNTGASEARRPYLWFLHADSHVDDRNFQALQKAIDCKPDALHYFTLDYGSKGPVQWNAHGANIRSRLFGLPFGDQGLCLSKAVFQRLGGYPEHCDYGEDLLLVRKARKANIEINHIPVKLKSSPRKYQETGWLKLTARRQIQMMQLMMQKI